MKTFAICGHLLIAILSIHQFAFAANPPADSNRGERKLIEFGSAPSSEYLKEHISEVEKLSFDGIVLDIRKNDSTFGDTRDWFSWSDVWSNTKLREQDFSKSIAEIKSIPFKRFTDNFFRFNTVNGRSDWFDQEYAVNDNVRLLARWARAAVTGAADGSTTIVLEDRDPADYARAFRVLEGRRELDVARGGVLILSGQVRLDPPAGWRDWGLAFAGLVLMMLPMLIVYIFLQRQLTNGITAGAVKG